MKEKEMTKQEAIDTLKLYSNNRFGIVSEPFWKAINIALEALKSQSGDEPDWSKAPELAVKSRKDTPPSETQDAETFCAEHMEGETIQAMYQFGYDYAGNDKYLFAIMADFANSRINGK